MLEIPSNDILHQLLNGSYADPFSILGIHRTRFGYQINVLMPNAHSIDAFDVHQSNQRISLQKIDERGFFAGLFTSELVNEQIHFHYQLVVQWNEQHQEIIEDPYRFSPLLTGLDNWLFTEGTLLKAHHCLGAHPYKIDNIDGVRFAVWAPNARYVSVVGDFNSWNKCRHPMRFRQESGIWELFLPHVHLNQCYKYALTDCHGHAQMKADPYAFLTELRPATASKITNLPKPEPISSESNTPKHDYNQAMSIYEVHLGSWQQHPHREGEHKWLSYQEIAEKLIPYVQYMGFTHIELLPITEHPFDGSWGYQPLGLYAPTSRFGSPDEFHAFIKCAHQAGIKVILDWVPGHFPSDSHGLVQFDGTSLYEHSDPKEGLHQDWNTLIYNYGRNEVRNYLASNALYWLEQFDLDGLRIDAVASMVYRDYSRASGEWIPNEYGGNHNLEAINLLKYIHHAIHTHFPDRISIAEESTAFPMVTQAPERGGLGFDYKWNMGWMNDSLQYMAMDPIYRQYHHHLLSFSMMYAYSERFVLPLSHDEVTHGKGSMLNKMPGDRWQQFANLRAYYGFMWGHPGKKLLFMGNEFAQAREWNHDHSLDWHLLDDHPNSSHVQHRGMQQLIRDLNHCYQQNSPLYQCDHDQHGFEWLVVDDHQHAVFAFLRRDYCGNEIIIVSNFTPIPRYHYRIGVHKKGEYREIINTDSHHYGGSNIGNGGSIYTEDTGAHQRAYAITLTIPPLATLYLYRHQS